MKLELGTTGSSLQMPALIKRSKPGKVTWLHTDLSCILKSFQAPFKSVPEDLLYRHHQPFVNGTLLWEQCRGGK